MQFKCINYTKLLHKITQKFPQKKFIWPKNIIVSNKPNHLCHCSFLFISTQRKNRAYVKLILILNFKRRLHTHTHSYTSFTYLLMIIMKGTENWKWKEKLCWKKIFFPYIFSLSLSTSTHCCWCMTTMKMRKESSHWNI